jgi:hypothetical protein
MRGFAQSRTKLALSLLTFVTSSVFLVLDYIGESSWVTVVIAVLGLYATSKVAQDWVRNGNGPPRRRPVDHGEEPDPPVP